MTATAEGLEALQQEFDDARIPTDAPGFYEEFQFVRRESKVPHYLDNYAKYVQLRKYSEGYLLRAEEVIHVVAAELQLALQLDSSGAAYDETPIVMAKILEREGIWCYVVHGSVSMTFPINTGFNPFSFYAMDGEGGTKMAHGYSWVYAPPFAIVDMALISMNYPDPVTHFLPKLFLQKETEVVPADPTDIFNPAAVEHFQKEGISLNDALDRLEPRYREFAADFPARAFTRNETRFTFTPLKLVPTDTPLEQITRFSSKGRSAMQIYDHEIKPRLKQE